MARPDGLFALRAHPFGAALWAFSAAAALCLRLRRSSSASLRTAAAEAATSNRARRRVVEPSCCPSGARSATTLEASQVLCEWLEDLLAITVLILNFTE